MENQDNNNNNSYNYNRKNNHSRNNLYNRSMSDTDSQTSQVELYFSPLRSEDHFPPPEDTKSPSKALVPAPVLEKYSSPLRSPAPPNTQNFNAPPAAVKAHPPMYDRSAREDVAVGVAKVGPGGVVGGGEEGEGGGVGGERRSRAAVAAILRRPRRDVAVERAALGFRVCEVVVCLISFSVMASDKTQGWSGDSFDRYKEYKYCLSVNVIAFAYSGFQAVYLAYRLISGKHATYYQFDFLMDQILAYLLISASSSAATRVDDWVSNWGKDDFTEMAFASIAMSFLAFLAFAISSLMSGYNLCTHSST